MNRTHKLVINSLQLTLFCLAIYITGMYKEDVSTLRTIAFIAIMVSMNVLGFIEGLLRSK